ncbi:universal stress protein [Streptomyces sodiiphilus]|uniref:Universal stress protein n=1 Tax=Streptomyces sodiiphilus TaxID=226217 RepID=A0ABN2PPD5_9ACTN
MKRPVIVGFDGSKESQAALDWAAREAKLRDLPLHLVHAWIADPLQTAITMDNSGAKRLMEEAEAALAESHPGLPVTTELLPAVATASLPEQAEHAEFLVLGSRGLGPIAGFLLGSVALQVLARAKHPVVLVRTEETRRAQGIGAPTGDDVLVGVDEFGEPAAKVLEFAFAAAAARGAGVRAVHVWKLPTLFRSEEASIQQAFAEEGSMRAELQASLAEAVKPWREQYPDVPVAENVQYGNASQILLTEAASRTGLVVVGRRTERPALAPRIGPVAHAVVHHAETPVAVVPHH